jgi:hypothetical protein
LTSRCAQLHYIYFNGLHSSKRRPAEVARGVREYEAPAIRLPNYRSAILHYVLRQLPARGSNKEEK